MGLSLVGCFFVVRAYDVSGLDAVGVLAACAAMLTFAIYVVGSERAGERHQAVTTLFWAFGFATLFWALVTPWWAFPWEGLASTRNALLAVALVIGGTLVPFVLTVAALRHVPAPRVAVIATLEPGLAAVFAWIIHDEALAAVRSRAGWSCSPPWHGFRPAGPTWKRRAPRERAAKPDFLRVKPHVARARAPLPTLRITRRLELISH